MMATARACGGTLEFSSKASGQAFQEAEVFAEKNQKISFPPRSNSAILSLIKADMAGEAKVAFDIFSNQ
jgi:hypothetical protein